jgi:hypothetical protein
MDEASYRFVLFIELIRARHTYWAVDRYVRPEGHNLGENCLVYSFDGSGIGVRIRNFTYSFRPSSVLLVNL